MASASDNVAGAAANGWKLEQTYAGLPPAFFADAAPTKFRAPRMTVLNERLAEELGLSLGGESPERLAAWFTGLELPPGARPIAQAYAGHQFGGFTMLGDGRAILLGEQRTPSGRLIDIQLKGAGQTPFSRRGDGRAALGPMLREYLISEAMAALGVPTTRSLAVATTGEPVYRETMLRGAVLTRTAASHIRVGTFQYLAARRDEPGLKRLADYTIDRHYPDLSDRPAPQKYLDLLIAVTDRQASLIARWQAIGFVHGVMNTDNMAVSGETIDYGPCAFLDSYHSETVFSSIDQGGRYAYGNQPAIGQWNLARFAETLLPLLDADQDRAIAQATEVLNRYPSVFQGYWLTGMCRKLGLRTVEPDDVELVDSLLDWMEAERVDFTNTFFDLSSDVALNEGPYRDSAFQGWRTKWLERRRRDGGTPESIDAIMRRANPAVIPRNHRVEEALAAAEGDDLSVLRRLLDVLTKPYERTPASEPYRAPPPAGACHYRTFCGT